MAGRWQMVTEKKLTAVSFAALICTVLILLGYCAAFSIEAEDARAEAAILRMQMQDLKEHDADLRVKLVTLSDEYHALYDDTHGCNESAWQQAGEFTICHYCSCPLCCGKRDGITSSGTVAEMGRTVAVDPEVIPLGSEVLLNGVVYVAEDTGVHGNVIDVFIESHEQATDMGIFGRTSTAMR